MPKLYVLSSRLMLVLSLEAPLPTFPFFVCVAGYLNFEDMVYAKMKDMCKIIYLLYNFFI